MHILYTYIEICIAYIYIYIYASQDLSKHLGRSASKQ